MSWGSSPHVRGTRCRGGRIGLLEDPTRPAFKTGTSVGGVIFGFSISVGSDAVPICRAPIARGYAFRTVGDHPRMCGEHANVCVFMTYLQQNLLAYPEHLSMLQNPIQHWFSCFSLHQFCFCLAGCHDALQPRRHTACSFSPPTSDSQEISLKNNLSCDGMCGMIGISQASCVCSIEVRPMGAAPFCWTASI